MILSNYAAAFMGNRQLANQNTDDIVSNTYNILAGLDAETDTEKNFVNAAINGMSLKFLRHRSGLNSSVLAISEKMADINSQLIEVNKSIMEANESIVNYNAQNIKVNSDMLKGSISPAGATAEKNAAMIGYNTDLLNQLSENVEANRARMKDLVASSMQNSDALMENKADISERRASIIKNREDMSENRSNI